MKEIIEIELKTRKIDFSKCKTDLLATGLFSDVKGLDKLNAELDEKLGGAIEQVMKLGDFKGKAGTSAVVYGNDNIGAKRVLLVGLGEKKKATLDTVRKAAANAAKKSVELKAENLSLALHRAFDGKFDLAAVGRAMAEGTYLGSYRYDEFVTGSENGRLKSLSVEVIDSDSGKEAKLKKGLSMGIIIGKAQSYARTLANRPANVINPETLAAEAKKTAKVTAGLTCTILDEKQMAAKGMGGILAVGSGSKNPPRFIVLKYSPAGKAAKNKPTIALVGKAITFDSGGICIKPSANMDEMKFDKSGGIAVLGTMKAAAELKLPINIYGIIPAAENMPSGTSYRPGDIITTFSGKTVEVLNTDAEGRMILCDALAYAVKQDCDVIIDIATLTGACVVALGKYMAGLMGNDEKLMKQLQTAAEESGEKVWLMPSGDEYAEEMKSKIADLKNTGSKWGGACTAAAFLRQFTGDAKWAHVDIAGMDMFEAATEHTTQGSSGFGVRLLTTYLMNIAK
ncbi:MAG: leucyl aminopeptidase [Phycisphaerae bacterium]|nr:leucyl aminopeptidase [Phycisphaerae bacterium]MDD5380295.1 leucyl aminopeptidase [Phycisphaerae bacterium]